MNFYNGKIAHADLSRGKVEEQPLDERRVKEYLGGSRLATELLKEHAGEEPIVLGTGPLTGSPFPAGSLAVVSATSPLTGTIGHVPITWMVGAEFKLSGFDFLLITGRAEKPGTLWLHDGLAELEDAGTLWGKDTWEAVDSIRKQHGDENIQVLCIGQAGEAGSPLATLSENYWGSKDALGMGAIFGRKNLKAVAMRGLGSIQIPEKFFAESVRLREELQAGAIKDKMGFGGLLREMSPHLTLPDEVEKKLHRTDACFSCPYPCYAFFKYREDPREMRSTQVSEPGVLVSHPLGFAKMANTLGVGAFEAMELCCRLGLEPVLAAGRMHSMGKKEPEEVRKELLAMSREPPQESPSADVTFSPAVPGDSQRQALAYTLGICPIFALVAPELKMGSGLEI